MKTFTVLDQVARLEDQEWLDPIAGATRNIVGALFRPQWLRDLLHGVPIGHPLHPLAAQIPLGLWAGAAGLDLVPGTEKATTLLAGAGVLSALPAASAGLVDWAQLDTKQSRTGVVHAACVVTATGIYALSFLQRARGRHASGKFLGFAGFSVVLAGAFLGGHLSYRQTAGVNHARDIEDTVPKGWHSLGRADDLPNGELQQRQVGDVPLVVLRTGSRVDALSGVCSHLGGPLAEGALLVGPAGTGACVECPWHKSVFSMRTGDVVHGPATTPQPCLETKIQDGEVFARLASANWD